MILSGETLTFLGVLATTNILCVFSNSNNFIRSYLDRLTNVIFIRNKNFGNDILKYCAVFLGYLEQRVKKVANVLIAENKHSLILLYGDIYWFKEFVVDKYSIELRSKLKRSYRRITNGEEQFFFPLYSFLFCIIVFICNDLTVNYNKEFVTLFLIVFIILSYVLSIICWSKYVFKAISNKKFIGKKVKCTSFISYIDFVFCFFLFWGLVDVLTIYINNNIDDNIFKYLFVSSLFIFSLIKGCLHFISTNDLYKYHKTFIISHFFYLLIVSFMCMFILTLISGRHLDLLHSIYTSLTIDDYILLKYSIILFVILNGLFLPFALPYILYFIVGKIHLFKFVIKFLCLVIKAIKTLILKLFGFFKPNNSN